MLKIYIVLLVAAFSTLAQDLPVSHPWQQGTVQSLQLRHRTMFDPHSAEIDLDILGADGIVYETTLAYGIHKQDMIPGIGIVTVERRRKKTHLNIAVGSDVKFALSEEHGWLLDSDGAEQKRIIKKATLQKTP